MADTYIYPNGTLVATNLGIINGATAHAVLDEVYSQPNPFDYLNTSNAVADFDLRLDFTALPVHTASSVINFVKMHVYCHDNNDTPIDNWPRHVRVYLYIGGVKYYGTQITTAMGFAPGYLTFVWYYNPSATPPVRFNYTGINAIQGGIESNQAANGGFGGGVPAFGIDALHLQVNYEMPVGSMEDVRHVFSRRLRRFKRGRRFVEILAPIIWTQLDLGSEVSVANEFAPAASAEGWPVDQARVFRIVKQVVKPQEMAVLLTLEDMRQDFQRYTYWEVGKSQVSSSKHGQGIARVGIGKARTMTRNTVAWVDHPGDAAGGLTRVVRAEIDVDAYDSRGLLIENASSNLFVNPSFRSGITSWTNVLGLTASSSRLLFDDIGASFAALLTGNATPSSPSFHQTIAGLASTYTLSADFEMTNHIIPLTVQIRANNGAGNYWNPTTGAWAAGLQEASFVDADGNTPTWVAGTRYRLRLPRAINFSGQTSPFRFTFIARNISNGHQTFTYHVQLEPGEYFTSRMNEVSSGARGATTIFHDQSVSPHNQHIFPRVLNGHLGGGTIHIKLRPWWKVTQQGVSLTFFRCFNDANNYVDAIFDYTTDQILFRWSVAGVVNQASIAINDTNWAPGQVQTLSFRWTGPDAFRDGFVSGAFRDGEPVVNWIPANTADVFWNGVRGTPATISPLVVGNTIPFYQAPGGGANIDAALECFYVTPDIHTADEIMRVHVAGI
jgi:hypothetical protein